MAGLHVSSRRRGALAAIIFAACPICVAAVPHPDPIETASRPSIATGTAGLDNEEQENLSGAACDGAGNCLLVGDEMSFARRFTLHGNVIQPAHKIYLLTGQAETDAEGVAFADGSFYVIGSHSRDKDGNADPNRHFLYRFRFDPQASAEADLGSATAISPSVERMTLDPVIRASHVLHRRATEPPGETREGQFRHGTNIEGIAVAGGFVYIGFRGPVDDAGAVILRMRTSALFQRNPPVAETFRLPLGGGQGIRDMAAVQDGLIILAGPETRLAAPNPQLFFWRPGREPVRLGGLAARAGGNSPEAITVIGETLEAYRLLVLADGNDNDLTMIVQVPKQPPPAH